MVEYKSLYVRAGKRGDGTHGIIRTCGDMVITYDTKKDAEKDIDTDEIILDIGAVVDKNLMFGTGKRPHYGWLDISSRRK